MRKEELQAYGLRNGVRQYQIAQRMQISEGELSRRLREPSSDFSAEYRRAVDSIAGKAKNND